MTAAEQALRGFAAALADHDAHRAGLWAEVAFGLTELGLADEPAAIESEERCT